jgi:hypothetical protein
MFLVLNQDLSVEKQNELVSKPFRQTAIGNCFQRLKLMPDEPEWKDDFLQLKEGWTISLSKEYGRCIVQRPRKDYIIRVNRDMAISIRDVLVSKSSLSVLPSLLSGNIHEKHRFELTQSFEFRSYQQVHQQIFTSLLRFIYPESELIPSLPNISMNRFFQEQFRIYVYSNDELISVSFGKKKRRYSK